MREDFDPGCRAVDRRCERCGRRLEAVGVVFVRAIKDKAFLFQCRKCDTLAAVYDGPVLWEAYMPPPNSERCVPLVFRGPFPPPAFRGPYPDDEEG